MSSFNRRRFLQWGALTPAIPLFFQQSALAVDGSYEGNILIIVRMRGGNDGLNAVVPIRDDHYYKGRPTIAISSKETLPLQGRDLGLNPALADFQWLIDQGYGSAILNVGYPNSSRSHTRGPEIFETGSTAEQAPAEGWLGRYLDQTAEAGALAGIEFGDMLNRTLSSRSGRSCSIANPKVLMQMESKAPAATPAAAKLDHLRMVENELAEMGRQLAKASKGTGSRFSYPNTVFGESLRWAGNMIESGAPTRLYYVTLGSFDTPYSFDTHSDERNIHKVLYSEFASGMRSFAEHLKAAGRLSRVQLLTFSDFGRQVGENREGGTDHGDAGLVFAMGGKVRAGIHGDLPDIANANDGGLPAKIDFRGIYANVLEQWLEVDSQKILGEKVEQFQLISRS
ncbi:MAG: DUF1501 domain-containing protein [Acidobacteriia bacterium]|nr:DUF1501 domain-containing protein [Terriglobia bacterium]